MKNQHPDKSQNRKRFLQSSGFRVITKTVVFFISLIFFLVEIYDPVVKSINKNEDDVVPALQFSRENAAMDSDDQSSRRFNRLQSVNTAFVVTGGFQKQ